jgi:hypothetical protein
MCVNPDHLFLGTHYDNMDDKEKKGRGNHAIGLRNGKYTKPWRTPRGANHHAHLHPETRQGENNGRAKLTQADVEFIRLSSSSSASLGREFGVTKTTILGIRKGRLWKHI